MRMISRFLLAAALALSGSAAAAQESGSRFGLPVDCEMGTECFDSELRGSRPRPVERDYACGLLSYDGHEGTDFRVAGVTP